MTIWSRPNLSIQDVSLLSPSALGAQLSSSSSSTTLFSFKPGGVFLREGRGRGLYVGTG